MGVKWSFSDDHARLKQKIALRQTEMLPKPELPKVEAPQDQRLRVKAPAKITELAVIQKMIAPYISLGLHFSVTDNGEWNMRFGDKTDTGTMRMPPRVVLDCARRLME